MQPKRTLQITPRWFLTRWTTSSAVFGILPSYFLLSVCDSFIVPITIYGCVMCWYSKAAQSFVKGDPVFEAIGQWKIWPWFHKYYFQTHRTEKKSAWCRQVPLHYLSQCRPWYMSPYGVTLLPCGETVETAISVTVFANYVPIMVR